MELIVQIGILSTLLILITSFKSMLLKIMLIVVWYPLCVLFLYKLEIPLVGIIEVNRNLFSEEAIMLAYNIYLIGTIIIYYLLWSIRKTKFNFIPFKIGGGTHTILFLLFVASSYSLLQIRTAEGGSASFYLAFSTILLYCTKGFKNFFTIAQLLYLMFILSMGERVDSILAIVFILIMNLEDGICKEKYNKAVLYIGLGCLFILGIAVAAVRGGGNYGTELLLKSIYAQQTVTDVLYVYLSGVEYYVTNGTEHSLILNCLLGLFPGTYYSVTSDYNYTIFLINNFADNPGGGMFFTEGILVFGPLGVIIYCFILGKLVVYLFEGKNPIKQILFILLFVMFCRVVWYGFIYTYKPIIICGLLYFILNVLKSNYDKYISSREESH